MTPKGLPMQLPELDQRAKQLLGAVVREYIATAEPISSAQLVRGYRLDLSPATGADRCECDHLVTARLGEPVQRPTDVVADAGARVRERRDVEDDSHPAAGMYSNPEMSTPSVRGSGLFNAG